MATQSLASSGIDVDSELKMVNDTETSASASLQPFGRIHDILNVSLPCTEPGSRWDLNLSFSGAVDKVNPHDPALLDVLKHDTSSPHIDGSGALLVPALCHPHIHLDKAYLLSHPKYAHLQIEEGSFKEAMELTSKAKSNFEHDDLLERGLRVIDESVQAGVTSMRAFVEVDQIVGLKCIEAGKALKHKAQNRCHVQLCVFAQLPLFSGDDDGEGIRSLVLGALDPSCSVDVLGSTPYVEDDREKMKQNVEWTIDLALEKKLHLDFHLDYNLDTEIEPLVWHVIDTLKAKNWTKRTDKTIVLGHCTRLSLFKDDEWKRLKSEIGDLPISFVGLPTSDLFMMRTESGARGTLPVPRLIKDYGLNAAISINNIGNAFTPQGSCDPLYIASLGVGVYQAGTKRDAEILYECVSTRARAAIGLAGNTKEEFSKLSINTGQPLDMLLFNKDEPEWRTRRTVPEAVYLYDRAGRRTVIKDGLLVE
ncbi:Metallo-dependent hydrolase [Aureobasidium pullulans]|uniref:Metallo-dependent hydrolase n=1 Tax=Aureobasidium pullulans TaxID=5580 RepID=A0A4S9Z6B9_AURPU|nr:Metallo-dependent hydrolase [Aureobasidium pullulans]TIA01836.1 Metallo-dependent hydrolase [Aureobasidium pullulans]TIA10081.1 Metallo-dependent hydrolase [Aureobasidium pullulans]